MREAKRLKENKSKIIIFAVLAIVMMALIFIYAGHFLFVTQEDTVQKEITGITGINNGNEPLPVSYKHISEEFKGFKQEINIMEVDISNSKAKIMPVLSSDLIYGFDKLSTMASRKGAWGAINGGFFSVYGLPSGMVIIDGKLISLSSGRYPVLYISNGRAELKEIKSRLSLNGLGGTLKIGKLNSPAGKGEYAAYTPVYGLTNRAKEPNFTLVIRNGAITDMGEFESEAEIPEDGMLVTLYASGEDILRTIPFKKGDKVELLHDPQVNPGDQAYECGSWLVRNGKCVIGDRDAWVGVLTNHDPRTAIGIKADGKVVLFTVDGRQPGYSTGMTGKELAEFMLQYGVQNAAMLDGGASTEMLLQGKVVNKPSFKGQERPVAGGILVIY